MQKLNPQFKCCMNVVFDTISSDYWFNQMYYGTHGPFKRAEAGQAITFENDKVCHTQYNTTRKRTKCFFKQIFKPRIWFDLMLNFISIYNFFRLWFMVSSSLTPIRLYSTLVWYPKLPTDWRQLSGRRCTTMTPTGTGVTGAGGRVWPRTGQVGLQRWSRWYWWWYSQAWWRGLEWADRVNSAPLVLPW